LRADEETFSDRAALAFSTWEAASARLVGTAVCWTLIASARSAAVDEAAVEDGALPHPLLELEDVDADGAGATLDDLEVDALALPQPLLAVPVLDEAEVVGAGATAFAALDVDELALLAAPAFEEVDVAGAGATALAGFEVDELALPQPLLELPALDDDGATVCFEELEPELEARGVGEGADVAGALRAGAPEEEPEDDRELVLGSGGVSAAGRAWTSAHASNKATDRDRIRFCMVRLRIR
jgi:hypothetical protein